MAKEIRIRSYNPKTDYEGLFNLYSDSDTFGGQFDEARDSQNKINALITVKKDASGQLHRINHGLKDLALLVQRFCVRCLRQVHMSSHHEIFRLQGILERHTEH